RILLSWHDCTAPQARRNQQNTQTCGSGREFRLLERADFSSNRHPLRLLPEHDSFRKPVPTFRDHALALARLESALGLVDDVDAALAPHQPVVAMPSAQRLERIADFHVSFLGSFGGLIGAVLRPVNGGALGHLPHIPRYACRTRSLASSSGPVPSSTVRPVSIT